MPPEQCGGIPHRGTDLASHLLRSPVDFSSFTGKTVAILFVDLVKAFDRVIREFVVGWPHLPRVDKLAL